MVASKGWKGVGHPEACLHASKSPDGDGKVRWRADDSFQCRCPIPAVEYPKALTESYGWQKPDQNPRGLTTFLWRCAGCPCYKPVG